MAGETEITVKADAAAVAAVEAVVEAFTLDNDLGPRAEHTLSLVVEELVANVVNHGFRGGEPGQMTVRLSVDAESVAGEIVDEGAAFDPSEAPPPDLDAEIEDRHVGGLGVHLVRKLTRSFEYRRVDGRNVSRFEIAR